MKEKKKDSADLIVTDSTYLLDDPASQIRGQFPPPQGEERCENAFTEGDITKRQVCVEETLE